MNLTEVKKSIEKQFSRELRQGSKRNIVFWYDDEGVFADSIDTLELENVKIIKLYENNVFATKVYIEEKNTTSNLLVYSPMRRPPNNENWLTDTIMYSQTFSTDETSLHLLNFKIDSSLRHVIERNRLFFRHAERCKKFESYSLSPYTENRINIGIMSALCKLTAPSFDNVVQTLLIEMTENENSIYDSLVKYGDIDAFWKLVGWSYGYEFDDRSFERLSIVLLLTHLAQDMENELPKNWREFLSQNTNCIVLVDNFMKNTQLWDKYNKLAEIVAEKLNLDDLLTSWDINEMLNCDTFENFDKYIIKRINENITMDIGEFEKYGKLINSRRNKRFFEHFENEYSLLQSACEFLSLCQKHKDLQGSTMNELFANYTKEYYKFDFYYRKFIVSLDKLEDDKFRELFEKIENTYTNWFLGELLVKWCDLLGDLKTWSLPGIIPQQKFYDSFISRFVSDNERIVVIISDGLRYESATELLKLLNTEQKGVSELSTMFGVLPSYTKLGMAALLPNKEISITDKAEIFVDGVSTLGTENREKILRLYKKESVAITYERLIDMSKTEMGDLLAGIKMIYIYHDAIDKRGESSDREVFDATEKCLREISQLIKTLKNNISAINFIITSDHGYIYKRTPLSESDKTPKEISDSLETKRRFILTKNDAEIPATQKFSLQYLGKGTNDLTVITPRSSNCFKVKGGGVCYVHGGSSLQEVVIPVIKFKSDKNMQKSLGARRVSIGLTNLSRKITSIITYLTFFQNEKVDEKVLQSRIKLYFEDSDGNRVSNENIIIADSTSSNPPDRTYKEKFTLKDIHYDKTKEYYLVINNEDETVNKECARIPFIIDLVFGGGIKF